MDTMGTLGTDGELQGDGSQVPAATPASGKAHQLAPRGDVPPWQPVLRARARNQKDQDDAQNALTHAWREEDAVPFH